MLSSLLHDILRLHGLALYAIVGSLVFAEDAFLVGLVAPGETAAIIGGVAASQHQVSVTIVCAVVAFAAIAGDTVGYEIGRRYGPRIVRTRFLRRRAVRIEDAERMLLRRGGAAVFIGRFVAFVRTVIPFLAGSTRMHYGKFLAYNVGGGVVWAVACVIGGYLAGNSYQTIEKAFGPGTAALALAAALIGVIIWRVRGHRRRRATAARRGRAAEGDASDPDASTRSSSRT